MFDIESKKVIQFKIPDSFHAKPFISKLNSNHDHNSGSNAITENDGYINNENVWFRRPKIKLYLKSAFWKDFEKFSKYHYMTERINKSAFCFTIWGQFGFYGDNNDDDNKDNLELVGFISALPHSFGYRNGVPVFDKYQYREHRTVILPAYQGLGFGSRVCDAMAEYFALNTKLHGVGYRMQSKTAHPRYGVSKDNSRIWTALGTNHEMATVHTWQSEKDRNLGLKKKKCDAKKKMYYSHQYKLPSERDESDQQYLNDRVIVLKKYNV